MHLVHHRVATSLREDALDALVLMAGRHDEVGALASHFLVILERHLDAVVAPDVRALAVEVGGAHLEALGRLRDCSLTSRNSASVSAILLVFSAHSRDKNEVSAHSVTDRILRGADPPAYAPVRAPRRSRRALVPFAGWEMPVQYTSITDEHRAVRKSAGVFDVSHMGWAELAGEGAHDYLQARLSNDLDRIGDGQAQYTLLTNEDGGIVDDLIAYRRGDDYLLIVNASNVEADHSALADAQDVSDRWSLLAVQGPEALARLDTEIEPFTFRDDHVFGVRCLIAGTGYTGERGCGSGRHDDVSPLGRDPRSRCDRAVSARATRFGWR